MEKNYYDETVEKIQLLIKQQSYEKAYSLVSSELALPYVPQDYLPKFQALKVQLMEIFRNSNQKNLNFGVDELFKIIKNDEKVLMGYALSSLENVALINFIDEINQIYALDKINLEIKGLIYEMTVKQQINKDFMIDDQKINPIELGSIGEQKSYHELWEKINQKCNKDQSMINVAYFIYNKYLISNFVKYLTQQLDLDVVDNIFQLSLLFMNQITEKELDPKTLTIMELFK